MAVTDKCAPAADALRFNVLLLLDSSLSLRRTDPRNARRAGLEAVVNSLASLERSWSHLNQSPEFNFEINVAVDTFATGYTRHHGWREAGVTQLELIGRYDDITDLPADSETTFTDYRQALQGASQRFREVPLEGCNLLLWFTDGEHATQGTSTDVSLAEWEQLQDLCRSDATELLSERNVWSQAVLLSSGSPSDAPLSLLFRELLGDCTNALDGEISQLNAGGLESALHELIAEAVREVVCLLQTPDLLPGEEHACPSEDPQPCTDDSSIPGNGTAESPCEYHFTLAPDVESFRLSVDLTFLNRGIRNPDDVRMRLQSPSGEQSDPIIPATANSAGYQPVGPFWFLSRRLYDSRWEIIGHQAAEQLSPMTDWEWKGEWTMLFWGDTVEAVEDAAKVAAAIKVNTSESPSADLSLSDERYLVGFIENFPLEYQSVELRLRLDDSAGDSLYPTRPHLECMQSDCNPIPIGEAGRRFEVQRLFDEILWWDSAAGGGDGLKLRTAVDERGPVWAVAILEHEFLYGGGDGYGAGDERGRPLRWERAIGSIALEDLDEFIEEQSEVAEEEGQVREARRQWVELQVAVEERISDLLPQAVGLSGPCSNSVDQEEIQASHPDCIIRDDSSKFLLGVDPGYFPGVVTLEDASLEIEGRSTEKPKRVLEWLCPVEGTWDGPSDDPPACGEIEIDMGLSADVDVAVGMHFTISLAPGLEETLRASVGFQGNHLSWSPSDDEWSTLWSRIQEATAPRRQSLQSDQFSVDLPTPGDKLREFLPILTLLVVLALLLRVFAAWRLRPWSPLASAEYMAKSLDVEPDSYSASRMSDERELCMELTQRSASGRLSSVRLFAMWRPLLLGGPPRLAAKSPDGQCAGAQGSVDVRKGKPIGLIGHRLEDGWVVEMTPTSNRLIVWDLPPDDDEAQARLAEAESAASYWIEQMQDAASGVSNPALPDSPEVGLPESPSGEGRDPFAAREPEHGTDPFSTENSMREEDSRHIDPFDQ